MADVSLTDVTRVYPDGVVGVEEISLRVADGEFLSLVGPSGCGKTTTLEMLAGLQVPTDGNVRIGTEIVNEKRPQNRDLAMVFQDYALYPHQTVRGNMLFGLKYSTSLDQNQRNDKVDEVAELLGISQLLDQKPEQLSGGQQQRVALGRAIVRDPEVFLLDEPLSNLDAKLRTEMRAELQRIQAELDVTMIYVTHNQTEAMTMSDRIAILNEGKLQQVGTPSEVYNKPENEFVAQFIGSPSMNLFDGNAKTAEIDLGQFQVQIDDIPGQLHGKEVSLGIRPEDLAIYIDGSRGDATAIVDVVEQLGSENLIHINLHGQTLVARVDERINPTMGDQVGVAFPPDRTYLSDSRGNTIKHREVPELGDEELVQF